MIIEFIRAAMKLAKYEIIENEEKFYGTISELKGVWSTGKTLEECRENLESSLEDWILACVSKGIEVPEIEGRQIMIMSEHSLKKDWDNEYDERWNRY